MKRYLLVLAAGLALGSCGRQPMEKFQKVDNMVWSYKAPSQFDVDIKEAGNYKMIVQVRYNADYMYSNVWIGLTEKKPDGTEEKTRFNIPLFDITGRPYGSFAGKFFDRNYPDAELDGKELTLSFPKPGKYTLTLQHNMRQEDLIG